MCAYFHRTAWFSAKFPNVSKLIWMKQIALYWFLISPIIKAILNKHDEDLDAEQCQQFILVVIGKTLFNFKI